jgi:4-amino-4-deoxy-L-arabinose transferase-like glycosyltransferase
VAERAATSRVYGPVLAEALALSLILALAFAVRWPFRHMVLIRDEGEYAYLGQQILHGAVPYLDVYNQKTPFTFYLMAAFQWLAGPELAALRVATTVYGLVATVMLYLVVRRLFDPPTAIAAALAFALMTFDQCGMVYSASTEFFMLPWILLALFFWYGGQERRRGWMAVLAGVAAGLAYQTKQTGIAVAAFLILDSLWSFVRGRSMSGWVTTLKDITLAMLGFAAVLGLVLAYFAMHGALYAYVACTWTNNWQYVARRHHGFAGLFQVISQVATSIATWDAGLWVWGSAGLIALALERPARQMHGLWILLVLLAGTALGSGQPYRHYYEPLIVPLAIGNGVMAVWLWRHVAERRRWFSLRALLLAILIFPWLWPAVYWTQSFLMTQAQRSRRNEVPPFGVAPRVARYLADRVSPDEEFLVAGSEPEIYYYANRKASTRLVFTYPLTGPYSYAPSLREEFQRDLQQRMPRYVVLALFSNSFTEWSDHLQEFLVPVKEILNRDYTADADFTDSAGRVLFTVFRRKDDRSAN